MQFKNTQLSKLKQELQKYNLNEELIDKIIIHKDDNWIEQLLIKLSKCENETEALSETLSLFLLKSFDSTPQYVDKTKALQIFPISKRKFEDLTRNKLLPYYEINQKNRIFKIEDIYHHIEHLKVDSIVNTVNPIQLHSFINASSK